MRSSSSNVNVECRIQALRENASEQMMIMAAPTTYLAKYVFLRRVEAYSIFSASGC